MVDEVRSRLTEANEGRVQALEKCDQREQEHLAALQAHAAEAQAIMARALDAAKSEHELVEESMCTNLAEAKAELEKTRQRHRNKQQEAAEKSNP